jgi:LmbE family N-acetylglucosaminyl deacetylase
MKIVIFAPHPDDEVFGCGGSIIKWMDEGHEVHVIYISDNRATREWAKKGGKYIEDNEFKDHTEEQMAEIGIKEAIETAKFMGVPDENVHLFKFPDTKVEDYFSEGVELSTPIVKDADRVVIPSDHNNHPDHQATHDIVKRVAQELNLENLEFFIYCNYNPLKVPKEKLVKVRIGDLRHNLYDALQIYRSQFVDEDMYQNSAAIKERRTERFGVFKFDDIGKYYNF